MAPKAHDGVAVRLQDDPLVYVAVLPGKWLLERTTPSWRMKDPEKGFQRIVKEQRARQIASNVLKQKRTFPNAIILATDVQSFKELPNAQVHYPASTKFLVVDGQHRLWAQKFSPDFEASYACIIHMARDEREMARLFLEINDNQKRVPSSLRWDLVRLVQPEGDEAELRTADLIYQLAMDEVGPLYQRIDLTGEQPEIKLKQGSLAPELKKLLQADRKREYDFDAYVELLTAFFAALKSLDPDNWATAQSVFYKARVVRALIRLLTDIVLETSSLSALTAKALRKRFEKIDTTKLTTEELKSKQGAAGVQQIYEELKAQVG
jgi:DGQHR domain-containing protein